MHGENHPERERLCDGPVYAPGRRDRESCDAPVCSNCSRSTTVRGHMHANFGVEIIADTIDHCPFCVDRYAAKTWALERPEHDERVRMHAATFVRSRSEP
jgi:hypothetical protein